jgi:ribonuclease HI
MFVVRFDGGARGNPGPAGAGALLMSPEGRVLRTKSKWLSRATNNEAEYQGLIAGLELAVQDGVELLVCEGDSKLVVEQMKGAWRVKAGNLKGPHAAAKALAARVPGVRFRHIPRAANAAADALANRAMDSRRDDS